MRLRRRIDPALARAAGALLALAVVVACGGPRSLAPAAPKAQQFATLDVAVKVASGASRGVAIVAHLDGQAAPAVPNAIADVSGGAGCTANSDGSRTCTVTLVAPVGLDDLTVTLYDRAPEKGRPAGHVVLSGTILRQSIGPGRDALGVAAQGPSVGLRISPGVLISSADGATHDIPFAVIPVDAHGFYVLGASAPAAHVSVSGDPLHALEVGPQGADPTAFVAHYNGSPAGDVKLVANAPNLHAASADFTPLVVSPSSLEVDVAAAGQISASMAGSSGPFSASVSGAGCAIAPASASATSPGATVTFSVTAANVGSCQATIANDVQGVSTANGIVSRFVHVKWQFGVGPSKIKHVVFVIQENRSFDNIFGGLDNNGKPFPGADTVSNPKPGEPTPPPGAMQVGKLEECYDPYHDHPNSVQDVDGGKMDGFGQEPVVTEPCANGVTPSPNYVYRTIEYSEVTPYWQMGEAYAVGDRMFEPFSSASFGPHLYAVAGQSDLTIDNPGGGKHWGCDGGAASIVDVYNANGGEYPGVFTCFNMTTLADILDSRSVAWRWYATGTSDFGYNWNAYDAINQIRNGPDWTGGDVVTPPGQFVTDVGNGKLASMTWITPTQSTSDHPEFHSNTGPAWITSVVNAVGTSSFWDSSAVFIIWDDWGGWYDHVPPPVVGPVGLGIRVPFVAISPYVKAGYVSHTVHTSGSILHFAEEVLNLPSLGTEDARADDLSDMFNFSQAPLTFTKFNVKNKAQVLRAATKGAPNGPFDPSHGD